MPGGGAVGTARERRRLRARVSGQLLRSPGKRIRRRYQRGEIDIEILLERGVLKQVRHCYLAISIIGWFDRPPLWLEFVIYVALGILWVLPFKRIFRGVGKEDPDAAGRDE